MLDLQCTCTILPGILHLLATADHSTDDRSFSGGIAEVVPKFECARLSTSVDQSSSSHSCGILLSCCHFSHDASPPLPYKVAEHDEGTAKSTVGFPSGIGGSIRYGLRTDGHGGNATQGLIEGELVSTWRIRTMISRLLLRVRYLG
jgi:hypothetical protein